MIKDVICLVLMLAIAGIIGYRNYENLILLEKYSTTINQDYEKFYKMNENGELEEVRILGHISVGD